MLRGIQKRLSSQAGTRKSGTFTFLLGGLGVALYVTTLFVDLTLKLDDVILVILVITMLTFGVNYLIVRRRES